MRKRIIQKIKIKLQDKNIYNNTTIDEIIYGIEALYVVFSRTILFLTINVFFKTVFEFFVFLAFYGLIRSFSYGFHAKDSSTCILLSSFGFILIPVLSGIININFYFKLILILFSLIAFLLWSPSDTENKPLINKKNSFKLKIISILILISYAFIILLYSNKVSNILLLILIEQSIFISPLMYKLFKAEYKNYSNYGLNN